MRATFRSSGSVKEIMPAKTNARVRTGAGLLALALALGGCGAPNGGASGSGSGGSGPDGPVAGTPGTGIGNGGGGGVVSPRPGMADVHPVEWDEVRLAEDDRSLWLKWWSGVEPCHVLDRIEVQVGPRVVIVTLLEGRVPGKEDVACPEMAQLKEAKATLAEPVDGRRVVDGAKLGALPDPDKCGPGQTALKRCR
ncbi:MAG: hypothetical protein H0W55_02850 [Actinobacteria bacterium]|nr:hypothetical protein [Actinomycetota bacterium]MDQ3532137.1 hypothetical protein [Actinomycetota bacterium]